MPTKFSTVVSLSYRFETALSRCSSFPQKQSQFAVVPARVVARWCHVSVWTSRLVTWQDGAIWMLSECGYSVNMGSWWDWNQKCFTCLRWNGMQPEFYVHVRLTVLLLSSTQLLAHGKQILVAYKHMYLFIGLSIIVQTPQKHYCFCTLIIWKHLAKHIYSDSRFWQRIIAERRRSREPLQHFCSPSTEKKDGFNCSWHDVAVWESFACWQLRL